MEKEMGTVFLKFVAVGACGFAIDITVTWLLKEKGLLNKYISNSIGFLCGLSFNFVLNRHWTFQSSDPNIFMQYLKFGAVGLSGLLLVNSLIYALHEKAKIPFFPAKVISMIVFMFWNFTANYYWTFDLA